MTSRGAGRSERSTRLRAVAVLAAVAAFAGIVIAPAGADPAPAGTITPTATPTATPAATATPAPTATPTATPAPTATPTATPAPTATPTVSPKPPPAVAPHVASIPAVVPDRKILVELHGPGTTPALPGIYVADLDSGFFTLLATPPKCQEPLLSPDSTLILMWCEYGDAGADITVTGVDGSNPITVAKTGFASLPDGDDVVGYAWSPDSGSIYYNDVQGKIHRVGVSGSQPSDQVVATGVPTDEDDQLAFPTVDPADGSLWVGVPKDPGMNSTRATGLFRVSQGAVVTTPVANGSIDWPSFSPDGMTLSWVDTTPVDPAFDPYGHSAGLGSLISRDMTTGVLTTVRAPAFDGFSWSGPLPGPVMISGDGSTYGYLSQAPGDTVTQAYAESGAGTAVPHRVLSSDLHDRDGGTGEIGFVGGEFGGYTPSSFAQDDSATMDAAGDPVTVDVLANDGGTIDPATLHPALASKGNTVVQVEGSYELRVSAPGVVAYRVCPDAAALAKDSLRCSSANLTVWPALSPVDLRASIGAPVDDDSGEVWDGPFQAAQTIDLPLVVTNPGPGTPGVSAVGVTLSLDLPAGAGFDSVTDGASPAACHGPEPDAAGRVSCDIGSLPPGSQTVTVQFDTPDEPAGPLPLTLTVSAQNPDPDPGNNAAAAHFQVGPSVDLSAALTGPGTAAGGKDLTLDLGVTNPGASPAYGATVSLPIPAGFGFGAVTEVPGAGASDVLTCTAPAVGSAGTVSCTGDLPPGTRSLNLVLSAPTASQAATFTETASADNVDPDPDDNTSTISVQVDGINPMLTPTVMISTPEADSVPVGQPATVRASVAYLGDGDHPTPTGTVVLLDGGTGAVGPIALDDGRASFAWTPTTTGAHQLSVSYSGDTAYFPAVSPGAGVTVTEPPPPPQVSISLSHTDPFAGGGTGTYAITGANTGAGAAQLGDLTLTLPSGISYTGVSIPGMPGAFTCSVTQPTAGAPYVDCAPDSLTTLQPGGSLPEVDIQVAVAADSTGGIAIATLTLANSADGIGAQDPTTVIWPVDLQAALTGDTSAAAGAVVTLHPTLTQVGGQAGNVVMTLPLPVGSGFVSLVPDNPATALRCTTPAAGDAGVITCTAPGIDHETSTGWTLRLTVPTVPGTLALSESVRADNIDPQPANNTASLTLTVTGIRVTPQVNVNGPNAPVTVGDAVALDAMVLMPVGAVGADPTGTVVFSDETGTIGDPVALNADGHAAITWHPPAAGVHTVSAAYSGDGSYLAATSAPFTVTVRAASGPDIAVGISHVPDPFLGGQSGTYTVTAANIGTATATLTPLTLTLPAGMSFVDAATPGQPGAFSCTATGGGDAADDGQSVTCTPESLTSLPAGAEMPDLDIRVLVERGSPGGDAVAHLSSAGDLNTANDTVSDPTSVGVPGVNVSVGNTSSAPLAGQRVSLQVLTGNTATSVLAGPITTEVIVPTGQGLTLESVSGKNWTCRSYPFFKGSHTLVRCVNGDDIPAAEPVVHPDGTAGYTIPQLPAITVTVDISPTAALTTQRIAFIARDGKGEVTLGAPYPLVIGRPKHAHLSIGVAGSTQLSANGTDYTVTVQNNRILFPYPDGTMHEITGVEGATSGPLMITLPLPAGATVTADPGGAWSCSTDSRLQCVSDQLLLPGQQATPLRFRLAQTPPPITAERGVTLIPAVTSTDAFGSTRASSAFAAVEPVSPRAALRVVLTASGPDQFTAVVHNFGDAPTSGPVDVATELPAGFTGEIVSADPDWGCAQTDTTFACTSTTRLVIPPGGDASPPPTKISFPAGYTPSANVALPAGVSQYLGLERTDYGVSGATSVPAAPPPPPAPALSTDVTVSLSPLYQGEQAVATLELRGDPAQDFTGSSVFAMILPPGVTATGPVPGEQGNTTPASQFGEPKPGRASTPVGGVPVGTLGTGMNTISCRRSADLSVVLCVNYGMHAGTMITIPVAISVDAATAEGDQHFRSGFLAAGKGLLDRPETAFPILASRGASALKDAADTIIQVLAFTAVAGPPQRVTEAVPTSSGGQRPTTVVMDASGTPSIGRAESYAWTQTSGPAVTWAPPVSGATPAHQQCVRGPGGNCLYLRVPGPPAFPGGTQFVHATMRCPAPIFLPGGRVAQGICVPDIDGVPETYGVHPSFTAPSVAETTTLGFRLYVTDGSGVHTADTNVVLDPRPDSPPVVRQIVAVDTTSGAALAGVDMSTAQPTPIPATAPASVPEPTAGDTITVTVSASDPDGDTMHAGLSVLRPASLGVAPVLTNTTQLAATGTAPATTVFTYTFTWPTATPQLTLRAAVTDGHTAAVPASDGSTSSAAVTSYGSLDIGPDAPPVAVHVAAPSAPATPGSKVNLTATVDNAVYGAATTTLTWSVVPPRAPGSASTDPASTISGISLGATTGTTTSFTVPSGVKAGDQVVVQVIATRGGDSAVSTTVIVPLAPPPPLTVAVTPAALTVAPGRALALTAAAAGGTAPYSYAWTIANGGGQLSGGTTAAATFTAGSDKGFVTLALTVTDKGGQSSTQLLAVLVGDAPAAAGPGTDTSCDTSDSPIGALYQEILAVKNAGKAPSDGSGYLLTLGKFTIDLGHLDPSTGSNCSNSVSVAFSHASGKLGPVTFTDMTGSLSTTALTITSGTISTPSAWHLPSQAFSNFAVTFSPFRLSGAVTYHDSLPFLSTPSAASHVSVTLCFGTACGANAKAIAVTASADVASGTVSIDAGFDPDDSDYTANVTVANVQVFGHPLNGTGVITDTDGTITGEVDAAWANTTPVAVHGMTVQGLTIKWTKDALTFAAAATFNDHVSVSLSGEYDDADNWSFTATGTLSADWPVAGLTIAKGTTITGSVASKKGANDPAAAVTFDLTLNAALDWSVGPLTVNRASITIADGSVPATGCPPEVGAKFYLMITGQGTLAVGGKTVALTTAACMLPDTGDFLLTSTATLSNVTIVSDLALSAVSLAVSHTAATGYSAVLAGTLTSHGVTAQAVLALLNAGTDGGASFLVAAKLPTSRLNLPIAGNGWLMYASSAVPDLGAIPGLNLGAMSASAGVSGLSPAGAGERPLTAAGAGAALAGAATTPAPPPNPLSGISIEAGFNAIANFSLPQSLRDFLTTHLGIPSGSQVLIQGHLGAEPKFSVTLTLGAAGAMLYDNHRGVSIALHTVSLTISLGASTGFGLDAKASLTMPNTEDPAHPASVALTASVAIQVSPSPGFTVALSLDACAGLTPDQCRQSPHTGWNDAFGISGLDISQLAVQGGIQFSPFVPSFGFLATVTSLPPTMQHFLGITPYSDNANGHHAGDMEPITVALNVSETNPIVDVEIGVADGHPAAEPLKALSDTLGDDLQIDDLSLLIAPSGGDIGAFHYQPGIHLRFDATVIGVQVDVKADLSTSPFKLNAHAQIGDFAVGPFTIQQSTLDLKLDSSGFAFDVSGGIKLPGQDANVAASLAISANKTSGFSFDLEASANDLNLGVAQLDHFHMFAKGALAVGQTPSFQLGLDADATILGNRFTVYGDLTLSSDPSFDLVVASGPIAIGPIALAGSGCDADQLSVLPADFDRSSLPTDGPCIQIGYHSATGLNIALSGSLSVAGLAVTFNATLDDKGLALDGTLDLKLAQVAVSGEFYFGSGLAGVTATVPAGAAGSGGVALAGDKSVPVSAGDFTLSAKAAVGLPLGGLNATMSFDVGSVGAYFWISGQGTLVELAAGYFKAALSVSGFFSRNSGGDMNFDVKGNGSFAVGVDANGNGGFNLVSLAIEVSDGFAHPAVTGGACPEAASTGGFYAHVDADVDIGSVLDGNVCGDVSTGADGVFRFGLNAGVTVTVAGFSLAGSGSIGNEVTAQNPHGYFEVAASLSIGTNPYLSGSATAYFDTGGNFSITVNANIAGFSGTAMISNSGVSVSLSGLGFTISGSIGAGGFDLDADLGPETLTLGGSLGPLSLTVSTSFALALHIHNADATLSSSGSASISGCIDFLGTHCAGFTLDMAVGLNPYYVCVGGSILDHDVKVCYSPPASLSFQ